MVAKASDNAAASVLRAAAATQDTILETHSDAILETHSDAPPSPNLSLSTQILGANNPSTLLTTIPPHEPEIDNCRSTRHTYYQDSNESTVYADDDECYTNARISRFSCGIRRAFGNE